MVLSYTTLLAIVFSNGIEALMIKSYEGIAMLSVVEYIVI